MVPVVTERHDIFYACMALKAKNDDAVLQVRAARALLIGSRLIQIVDDGLSITPFDEFRGLWENLDEKFGRLMYWTWFSAGAEYFIKKPRHRRGGAVSE